MAHALLPRKLFHTAGTRRNGFAQKVLVLGFLCATSVSSVSLWCGFTRNSSTTETQRTQRLHREERDRDFLCKPSRRCFASKSGSQQGNTEITMSRIPLSPDALRDQTESLNHLDKPQRLLSISSNAAYKSRTTMRPIR